MTRAVIDASVAVKLLVDEDGADQAMIVYRTFELLAPELLLAECANIIWKKTRRGELTAPEAELAAGLLARSAIDLRPMRGLVGAATRLAMALDHAAYDCLYLALAAAEDCPFITADERLVRKIEHAGGGAAVRLLSSFEV